MKILTATKYYKMGGRAAFFGEKHVNKLITCFYESNFNSPEDMAEANLVQVDLNSFGISETRYVYAADLIAAGYTF